MQGHNSQWLPTAVAAAALPRAVAAALLGLLSAAFAGRSCAADAAQVIIKNFMFTPATVTIQAGSTVTWDNEDQEPHTVVSDSGLFRSGAVDTHETFSYKFEQPGTYHFLCSIHPQMLGTIVVE